MTESQVKVALEEFADAAARERELRGKANYHIVNEEIRRVHRAFCRLVSLGTPGRDALLSLLTHPNPNVVLTAAVYSLEHNPDACLEVLWQLADRPDFIGFGAQQTIWNWFHGEWRLEEPTPTPPATEEPEPQPPTLEPGVTLESLGASLGKRVARAEIRDFQRFDERRALLDGVFPSSIGVDSDSVDWCPDNPSPTRDEFLAWLWLVRPELGPLIVDATGHGPLREAIIAYIEEGRSMRRYGY